MKKFFALITLCVGLATPTLAERYTAQDSLNTHEETDAAAARVVRSLTYPTSEFEVRAKPTEGKVEWDCRVFFPSPMPSGNKWQDTVRLRWFMAEGVAEGATAPAVILVHSLHPDLPVATMLARGLSKQGIQSFILELPGYGGRVGPDRQLTGATALIHGRQSITDCRRALDAVAVLPGVDPDNISVQGTSLGSFIATAASGLDQPFAYSFLLLAGGDGVDILERGDKDAFHVRGALQHYGYHGEKLRTLIEPMEPLMLAHRLNPQRTWMFNAEQDRVIPKANADMLAKAIGLTEDHHLWMPGNHYTSFALLPGVLGKMTQVIEGQAQGD